MEQQELIDQIIEKIRPELSTIVQNAINEQNMNVYVDNLFEKFIKNTTVEERKKAYESSLKVESYMFNSPLMENHTLSPDDVVDPYDAVEFLKRKYNLLLPGQIEVTPRADGKISFVVLSPNRKTEMDKLITDAERMGYFVGKKGYKTEGIILWAIYQFEPVSQPNVRSEISKNNEYLVHVTPITNLSSIKRNGFIKKKSEKYEGNMQFAHPERIYFVATKKEMPLIAENTAKMLYKARPYNGSKYALIYMRFEDVPDYITVHYDGNFANDEEKSFTGVFVEDNIPAHCIDSIHLYDCATGKYIKDSMWNRLRDSIVNIFKKK